MNIKLIYALFSLLFLIAIGLILVNVSQQKKINFLSKNLNEIIAPRSVDEKTVEIIPERIAEINNRVIQSEQNQLRNNISDIIGNVVSVGASSFIIKSQSSEPDSENSNTPDPARGIKLVDVEYVVNVNESTKFNGVTFATLKKDAFVSIVPTESVYGKTEFTAASIRESVQPVRPKNAN